MEKRVICKYSVPIEQFFSLDIPAGGRILTVQTQNNKPRLWVLVTPFKPLETRHFHIIGTGSTSLEENSDYVGTFQINDGSFVGHLFEIKKDVKK